MVAPAQRPPPKSLDSRSAIHQRLLALARQSELQRFTRTLAALEALHTNELHEQTRVAQQATMDSDAAVAEAEALRHSAAAKEAKLLYQIASLQSDAQRREQLLCERNAECEEAMARAVAAEERACCSEQTLSVELRRVESAHQEGARLLREFARAHEVKAQHLGDLQEQAARSTSLVLGMQEQAAKLQKRFAQQQRKSMRLQESQAVLDATQRTWSSERAQLVEAADTAAAAAREAIARQHELERGHAALVRELEAEREHSLQTMRHQRELAASAETSQRAELQRLRQLIEALEADATTRVTLKTGGAMPVGQYVRTLEERQGRARRHQVRAPVPPPTNGDGAEAEAAPAPVQPQHQHSHQHRVPRAFELPPDVTTR